MAEVYALRPALSISKQDTEGGAILTRDQFCALLSIASYDALNSYDPRFRVPIMEDGRTFSRVGWYEQLDRPDRDHMLVWIANASGKRTSLDNDLTDRLAVHFGAQRTLRSADIVATTPYLPDLREAVESFPFKENCNHTREWIEYLSYGIRTDRVKAPEPSELVNRKNTYIVTMSNDGGYSSQRFRTTTERGTTSQRVIRVRLKDGNPHGVYGPAAHSLGEARDRLFAIMGSKYCSEEPTKEKRIKGVAI